MEERNETNSYGGFLFPRDSIPVEVPDLRIGDEDTWVVVDASNGQRQVIVALPRSGADFARGDAPFVFVQAWRLTSEPSDRQLEAAMVRSVVPLGATEVTTGPALDIPVDGAWELECALPLQGGIWSGSLVWLRSTVQGIDMVFAVGAAFEDPQDTQRVRACVGRVVADISQLCKESIG